MEDRGIQVKQLSRGQRTSCVIPALMLNHNNAVPTHSCSFSTAVWQDSVVPHSNRAFGHSLCCFQEPLRALCWVSTDGWCASRDLRTPELLLDLYRRSCLVEWFRAGVGLMIQMAPGRFNAMSTLEGVDILLVGEVGVLILIW